MRLLSVIYVTLVFWPLIERLLCYKALYQNILMIVSSPISHLLASLFFFYFSLLVDFLGLSNASFKWLAI